MNVIKYESELCTGCKACASACWIDVIRWNEETNRPIFAYPEDCVECNFCEISCPEGILHVNADFTRPWPDIYHASSLASEPVVPTSSAAQGA